MRLLCPDLLPICFLFPIFTWKRSMFLSNRLMHLRYLLLVAVCVAVPALSQNICRISHREGFSNCSILSLAQDADGYVWAGSCDGLNLWDGHYARNFRLSGNLVQEIVATDDGYLWVRTNYGVDRVDARPEPPNCMPTSRVFTNIRHGARDEAFFLYKGRLYGYVASESRFDRSRSRCRRCIAHLPRPGRGALVRAARRHGLRSGSL